MRVDIERIQALKEEIDAFNRLDLAQLEFYERDVKLRMSPAVVNDWKTLAMSNVHFVELRPWDDDLSDPTTESCR